jgi:hypothetical protein
VRIRSARVGGTIDHAFQGHATMATNLLPMLFSKATSPRQGNTKALSFWAHGAGTFHVWKARVRILSFDKVIQGAHHSRMATRGRQERRFEDFVRLHKMHEEPFPLGAHCKNMLIRRMGAQGRFLALVELCERMRPGDEMRGCHPHTKHIRRPLCNSCGILKF